jgi:hypothetical protein
VSVEAFDLRYRLPIRFSNQSSSIAFSYRSRSALQ